MLQNTIRDLAIRQGYASAELAAAQDAYNRKWRLSHPEGRFDRAGRFTLTERCSCCSAIRAPSRTYPHSEMVHGRSVIHVATRHGVPKLHVQRLLRALDAASLLESRAVSHHARAQLLVKVKSILKPIRPAR